MCPASHTKISISVLQHIISLSFSHTQMCIRIILCQSWCKSIVQDMDALWIVFPFQYENITLQWRHNERDCVSNHQSHDCLLSHLFRRRLKKTSKLRVTGYCERNSPATGEFPAQSASNADNVSIWWRYHERHFCIVLAASTDKHTHGPAQRRVMTHHSDAYFMRLINLPSR